MNKLITTSKNFVGGCRIGDHFFFAFNATWPFAKISISQDEIILRVLIKTWRFPKSSVTLIEHYHGPTSGGIKVVHTRHEYPAHIVFWCFTEYPVIREAFSAFGYPIK